MTTFKVRQLDDKDWIDVEVAVETNAPDVFARKHLTPTIGAAAFIQVLSEASSEALKRKPSLWRVECMSVDPVAFSAALVNELTARRELAGLPDWATRRRAINGQ